MRIIPTILLALLAVLLVTASVFLTLDGNLARLTGWYHYRAGDLLFHREGGRPFRDDVTWMRIQSLHDTIECERDANGVWWIIHPYRDRMSQEAADAILGFTADTRLVDTLSLDQTENADPRQFGVDTTITLKVKNGPNHQSTVARYTIGKESPWMAEAEDGSGLKPTTYLRTDFYGNDKRIHVVTGNIRGIFKDGLSSVRDYHPLFFNPQTLLRVTITPKQGDAVVLTRGSAEMDWVVAAPVVTSADQAKANQLVSDLARMTAWRIDEANGKDIELPDKPECTFKLECEGAKPLELHLYKPFFSEDGNQQVCYATTSDRSVIFTLRAEPKVNRRGAYASIIQNVYQLPVLDKDTRLQMLPDFVYTQDLPRTLTELRAIKFMDIDPSDVGTFVLRRRSPSGFPEDSPFVRVDLRPGNAQGATYDSWSVTTQDGTVEADTETVLQFLLSMRDIPPVDILEDIPPRDNLLSALCRYGLDATAYTSLTAHITENIPTFAVLCKYGLITPTYTLLVAPRPCAYRAKIYGYDLPLVRAHEPRMFLSNRYTAPDGEAMWVGIENGGTTVYRLSTKLTRNFSLDVDRWRQRNLFSFPYSAVRHLSFVYQKALIQLDYNPDTDKWTGTMNGEDITPRINPYRAEHYVRQLQRMRVRQWLTPYDRDAKRALRHPVFTVKLELEITDNSDLQSVVIENPEDFSSFDASDTERVFSEDDAVSQAMRNNAFAERKTVKVIRTLDIVPMPVKYDQPNFYGRFRETGEIFILNFGDAQGLGTSVLDR